eukprot:GHVU01156457.1.p1 GENE.GHVU01156457.1~~GHVU01156457.1.p1  ORF type:complete len:186 (+),score=26.82 GHVU01156457.1:82-558(+)
MKAAAEKEAERRKEEENQILLEKHMLEEALARVQAHSFRPVLSPTSPRTKEVQETLKPMSHTGVAAGAVFSASASPCLFPQKETPDRVIELSPIARAQAGLSLSLSLSDTRPHSLWCIVCVCVCVPSSACGYDLSMCVCAYAREHRSTEQVDSGQEFV